MSTYDLEKLIAQIREGIYNSLICRELSLEEQKG